MNKTDMIYNHIIKTKILDGIKFANDYKYKDIMTPIVDAVFSFDEDNHRLTLDTINNFRNHYKVDANFTVNKFLKQLAKEKDLDLAKDILKSNLKTATKGGISRAEVVVLWAKILDKYGVQKIKDLISVYDNPNIEIKIKAINGQQSGETLHNFLRIAGEDVFIKPNRYMIDFVNDSVDQILKGDEVLNLLKAVVRKLKKKHPKISLRDLDYAIWYYMQTPVEGRMPNEIRNMNRPPKKGKIVPIRDIVTKSRR